MNQEYTGKNDLELDMPNNSYDLSAASQKSLGRKVTFDITNNHATDSRTLVIIPNRKSVLTNLIKTGVIPYVNGATDFICTPKDFLIEDWLYDLALSTQVFVDVDLNSTNALQMRQEFKIYQWDFYNNLNVKKTISLNQPSLRNQQDGKSVTISFDKLTSTENNELSIIIPAQTTTTFVFSMGAALRRSYKFQQKLLLAQAAGVK